MNIDEQIEIAKKQLFYGKLDKNMSIDDLTNLYQNLNDLLWKKVNMLMEKDKK